MSILLRVNVSLGHHDWDLGSVCIGHQAQVAHAFYRWYVLLLTTSFNYDGVWVCLGAAIPAGLLLLSLIIPETPRYLLTKHREEAGWSVILCADTLLIIDDDDFLQHILLIFKCIGYFTHFI